MADLGVPFFTAGPTISAVRADELVTTGNWIRDRELMADIQSAFRAFAARLPDDVRSGPVVEKSLVSLTRRGILVERDGRWRLAL